MEEIAKQIQIAINNKLYYLALYVTLTLPDILGALVSDDGIRNKDRYIWWFDTYVTPQNADSNGNSLLTGEISYKLRCSLLHEGKMELEAERVGYSRIIFTTPEGSMQSHCFEQQYDDEIALLLNVSTFCEQVLSGLRKFLEDYGDTEQFKQNYNSFVTYHPNGLFPYALGMPVIG